MIKKNNIIALNSLSWILDEFYNGTNDLNSYFFVDYYQDKQRLIDKMLIPNKYSVLHDYIEYVYVENIACGIHEYIDSIAETDYTYLSNLNADMINALDCYNIQYDKEEVNDIENIAKKHFYIWRQFSEIIPNIVHEIFYFLFQNKNFLRDFNAFIITEVVKTLEKEEYPEMLKKDGVVNRVQYIPEWLKRGIWYRDKGTCQICGKNLDIVGKRDEAEYDHIIPLVKGGINDVTNFQISCKDCNLAKGIQFKGVNNMDIDFWEL